MKRLDFDGQLNNGGELFVNGCVMALGFFDGVHKAHRNLLGAALSAARERGLPLAVFTFSGDSGIKPTSPRLYTDDERLALFSECGVDITVVCDFSSVCALSKEDFVRLVLVDTFNTRVAVCGYNFAFGKGASGDVSYLTSHLSSLGRETLVIDEYTVGGERVSTSRIRELISEGNMEDARGLLGAPYFISGRVEHGRGMGKNLGIPTVNTSLSSGARLLMHGVYASAIVHGGEMYHALTNVGECPTFGAREAHAETFIIDFDGDLYGKDVRIYLLSYLRGEQSFSTAEELVSQIKLDTDKAKSLDLEEIWQEIGQSLR